MAQTLNINLSGKYETKQNIEYTLAQTPNEAVSQLEGREWFKDKKSFSSPKYTNHAYWARIKVKNLLNTSQTYYFKSENQFTYLIDYYLVKNKKVVTHTRDGSISKNHNRAFNSNHMLFTLDMEANAEAEVYFRIRNYNKINIDFELVTQDYLLDFYQTYNLIEGLYFGGMMLMVFYNLFLYFLFRISAYIYYILYAFWLSVYFIGLFGFAERYFSSYTNVFYISSGAFFVFLTLFIQSILDLKNKLPEVHKFLNLFIGYFILTTLLNVYCLKMELFIYAQLLFNLFFLLLAVYAITIIATTYYLAFYHKDKIARFYSIIWSLLALMGILLPLQYLNIINIDIPADYIFQFLTLVEILFFSFILAHNINIIEDEKKKHENMLVQQNKLASMGEVIGMIAHQWRQPLSEINGVILNMDMDYRKKELEANKFNNYLDKLENITAYMSETINDFIDYFKHDKKVEEFSISELIKGTLNLISSTNKKNIKITYKKHPEIILNSYRSELIQSLLIVINNAIDACNIQDKTKSPEIIIFVVPTKTHTIIGIKDNGSGIPNDIIDKIYDPYFTTKHKSKGTGLGLYILKMIIEQGIQGKIEILSTEKHTTCKLFLPNSVTIRDTIKE
ncbi:MAG: Signal Transduction Histidine Kinase (STHK) with CheB and CheR activity [uncultured Sulfurovum sp.]|uniref:histidine kinase n=1 Tax=uncultured Sulfurovum sp. TaxID=269237 RepID=A0A6S6SFF6_9BACT|nr:MAG: Signal Transduction Histidine Kinase (STHK) with CheB and CheR activity [uncultured Sulfurovum sp.]